MRKTKKTQISESAATIRGSTIPETEASIPQILETTGLNETKETSAELIDLTELEQVLGGVALSVYGFEPEKQWWLLGSQNYGLTREE